MNREQLEALIELIDAKIAHAIEREFRRDAGLEYISMLTAQELLLSLTSETRTGLDASAKELK